jgi:hypothetical protein
VYALVTDPDGGALGAGFRGEPLRAVDAGGFFAVVGAMEDVPPLEPASLRGHDAVARRLAAVADAVLPARYGSLLAGDEALVRALAPRARELVDALDLVRGREQMTLRVYGAAAPRPAGNAEEDDEGLGPGTRYLRRRLREHDWEHMVPEIAPLRPALDGLTRAERVERHRQSALLASVYHLVDRGTSGAYLALVEAAAPSLDAVRVTASGPWPPYAFAPEGAL